MWTTVYLSLGSNLGERDRNIQAALGALESHDLRIVRCSPLYETEPRDYQDQPWFLNMVAEVSTRITPEALLARIREVESAHGRQRTIDKGPRTIDIDILTFGDLRIHSAELQIPHPRMHGRRFVLEPLADLAPDLTLPAHPLPVRELLSAVQDQPVRKWHGASNR